MESHLGGATDLAAGIHDAPGVGASFAATQAAFRFLNNPRVTLRGLAEPLLAAARDSVPQACDDFVLVVHDWTPLSYTKHANKKDRLSLSGHGRLESYEALTSLAISDRDGLPIAPLSISLRAADGMHCSRFAKVRKPLSPLDELDPAMAFAERQKLGRCVIHLADAEADSVAHYREWSSRPGRFYLVRADDRLVEHDGQERKCSEFQRKLRRQAAFEFVREVRYHDQQAQQFVAEIPVKLLRVGQRNRPNSNDRKKIPGEPLPLRLVICEVRDAKGKRLATWFLLSNAPPSIDAAKLALWYYWRWSVEKFFSLLKSAGVHVEEWRQESASAIARRLLVASMACVVVWNLARQDNPQADAMRKLLVRLSGRQMKRHVQWTFPSLLAGLWTLLAATNLLHEYTPDQIRAMANLALEKPP